MPHTTQESTNRLTVHQRHLVDELEETAALLKLDYQDIGSYERAARTPLLEMMRRKLTIAEVITSYTLIDEYLNARLCHYVFGQNRSFILLWKTRRFQLFNYHVLEELSTLAKLRFVKSISQIPQSVSADVERLNALRNGLAHAFFPENLKRSKPEWKGKNIFTADCLAAFLDDMTKLNAFFLNLDSEKLAVL